MEGNYTVTVKSADPDYYGEKTVTIAIGPARPAPAPDEVESFDHFTSAANAVSLDFEYETEWLSEFNGETGVVKLTYDGEWPAFSFFARRPISDYAEYDYIIIRMYIDDYQNPIRYFKLGNRSGLVADPLNGTIASGQWKDYIFPIDPFLELFKSAGTPSDYVEDRLWGQATNTNVGYVYISSITVSKDSRPAPAPNEVESFDHESSKQNAVSLDGFETIWHETFEGEYGVVQLRYRGEWVAFSFHPRMDISAYSDYDYIKIRMYVDDADNPIQYLILGNHSEYSRDLIEGRGKIASGQWKDYIFEITPFLELFSKTFDGDYDTERLWGQATNTNEGSIYISSITVLKAEELQQ